MSAAILSLPILLEDGPCLAVLKPAGLATQAPPGIDSAEARIKDYWRAREGKPGNIYLGLPHRLDRAASGVLLVARHVRAAQRISQQFERRQVHKVYWAAVAGAVDPPEGSWCDRLKKVYGHPQATIVDPDDPQGREAVLHYRTLGRTPHGSLLEIELVTGRTHQIRVQAASRGWPVLGDELYGCGIPFGPQHDDARLRAIALHGRRLELRHPMTGAPLTVEAPLPAMWEELNLDSAAAAAAPSAT
jgi:23S rRNA pseudouridine1911/1915/1917 synthase